MTAQEQSWSERIRRIIETYEGGNQAAFANRIGVTRAAVGKMLASSVPGGESIEEIARRYPSIRPEWLLTGRGDMRREVGQGRPDIQRTEPASHPDDHALFGRIETILKDQEISPGMRVLLIDAATSAWTKAALYRGAVAEEERARAVTQAEITQAARTEAIREVERNATDRLRLLHPEQTPPTGADTLPPLQPPPEPEGGAAGKETA